MAGLRDTFGCVSTAVLRREGDSWVVESGAGGAGAGAARRMPTSTCRSTPTPPSRSRASAPRTSGCCRRSPGSSRWSWSGDGCGRKQRRRKGSRRPTTLRTALLAAVSHDLRTPLASIKAAATSLLQPDVEWSVGDANGAARDDRRGGRPAQHPRRQPPRHEPAADRRGRARAARRRARRGRACRVARPRRRPRPTTSSIEVPETLPPVRADAALLERAVANLVGERAPREPSTCRCASSRERSSTGWSCVWSTGGPASRRTSASGCSSRSSASGTTPTAAASGSASRWRAGSSRRWTASCSSRTHRAAAPRWSLELPGGGLVTSRVLVVDDEPQILRALAINLRARGYEVDLARDRRAGSRPRSEAATPTSWSSTSGCPGSTACEVIRGLRGWSTRPGRRALGTRGGSRARLPPSTRVPTTT